MRVGDTATTPDSPAPVRRKFMRRRKQLEQDLEHITQEMYRRNRELADTNRILSLLQTINSLALEPEVSLDEMGERIADAIVTTTDYPLAAILTTDLDVNGMLELRGLKTKDAHLRKALQRLRGRTLLQVQPYGACLNADCHSVTVQLGDVKPADIQSVLGCTPETAHVLKKQTTIRSLYIVNLVARNRLVGILVAGLYSDTTLPQDNSLLDRLGEPVGVALDNRLLFEENKRVLVQLRRTNAKLKALDETKDEFITMASHQLRTPLTSVKGYLSMVLEGDAGKITSNQRKLLEQSFASSQRMVYLISDLLNLSRLNTGKFVIEPSPVNLSEVVEAEFEQLRETAKARDLEFTYTKPASFPSLMLDETKIHQVVMNLMDNAIYYTREGKVSVELRETPTAVEYMVHDTGIGVPRAVQHKLFTKFYRAGNAQQARPDGTGLGLFMVKKVVAAQGGSIIFESSEGKGSTFGFRFNKADHGVPAQADAKKGTVAS